MKAFRVCIFLCCAAAIFANGCNSRECGSNADCDRNELCDSGICETFAACDSRKDCLGSQTCVNGECRGVACESDADCAAAGGICIGDACWCVTNLDCDAGEKCFGGSCVPREGCESDADCDADRFCASGA